MRVFQRFCADIFVDRSRRAAANIPIQPDTIARLQRLRSVEDSQATGPYRHAIAQRDVLHAGVVSIGQAEEIGEGADSQGQFTIAAGFC